MAAPMGVAGSPFQSIAHDPAAGAWMKARVRNLAPDCCASAAGLSVVYASKYGANTCSGKVRGLEPGAPAPPAAPGLALAAATAPPATAPPATAIATVPASTPASAEHNRGKATVKDMCPPSSVTPTPVSTPPPTPPTS